MRRPPRRRVAELHPRPLVRARVPHAEPTPVCEPLLLLLPEPEGQEEAEECQGEACLCLLGVDGGLRGELVDGYTHIHKHNYTHIHPSIKNQVT